MSVSSSAGMTPQAGGRRPGRTWVGVGVVLVVVAAVRLWFVRLPLIPDEAGFYQVAQSWTTHGPNLYGHYFVDRAPGLIAMYKLAAITGHIKAIRLVSMVCALVTVGGLAAIAHRLRLAVLPATLVAAAFVATPVDDSPFASSGMCALPWCVLSMLALVLAVRRDRGGYLWAGASGLFGLAAMSVKQNFADGFVFALVALVALAARRELPVRRALGIAGAGVLGMLAGIGLVVLVALPVPHGLSRLWLAAVSFRWKASQILVGHDVDSTTHRMLEVVLVLVATGMVTLFAALAVRAGRRLLRGTAWAWAVAVTAAYEAVSVFAGGSYWPHYALQLTPALALGTAIAWRASLPVRVTAAVTMASAVLNVGWYAVAYQQHPQDSGAALGRWVGSMAHPGDTATVLYGHAEIQWATGMRSPYPQMWSLPTRTLDPRLADLTRILRGPHAPTWIVTYNRANAWGLDRAGTFRAELRTRYQRVARVCARPQVWLLRSARRELTQPPACGRRFLQPDGYLVDLLEWTGH